jgi:hypothetical protein
MKIRKLVRAAGKLSPVDLLKLLTLRTILLAALVGGLVYGVMSVQADARAIWRDVVTALVAHQRAGEPVPFSAEEADYSLSMPYPEPATWGIKVNSLWLLRQITYIVPYFAYEGIAGNAVYPDEAFFLPYIGVRSFTVGGQMVPKDWSMGGGYLVVNERAMTDPRWIDARRTFGTVVHELTHMQGGVFLYGGSANLESATVAATTEMLAAMCIYQNDLACGAFWDDIESQALVSLASRLPEWLYDLFADVFIRDADESFADQKNDRFWADDEYTRQAIREKYGRHPWETRVIPGIVLGRRLDTMVRAPGHGASMGFMAYDDTAALFGWRLRLVLLLGS